MYIFRNFTMFCCFDQFSELLFDSAIYLTIEIDVKTKQVNVIIINNYNVLFLVVY